MKTRKIRSKSRRHLTYPAFAALALAAGVPAVGMLSGPTAQAAITTTTTAAPTPTTRAFAGSAAEFYIPPAGGVGAFTEGTVLQWQPIKNGDGVAIPGQYRVMYVTTQPVTKAGVTTVKRVLATTAVRQPVGARPKGGFPTVATPHGLTGMIPKCGISATGMGQARDWMMNERVRTVAPDYIGLGVDAGLRSPDAAFRSAAGELPFDKTSHPFSVQGAGRATLDAVRAGRNLELILAGATSPDPARDLANNNQVLLVGGSQGGHGALSAAEVHAERYADDLVIKAVVAGAPPGNFTDLETFAPTLRNLIVPMIITGASLEHQDVRPSQLLNANGQARYAATADEKCAANLDTILSLYQYKDPITEGNQSVSSSYTALTSRAVNPALRDALEAMSPGGPKHPKINVPVFVGQVRNDPLVMQERTNATVAALRSKGAQVSYCDYPSSVNPTFVGDLPALYNHVVSLASMWKGSWFAECTNLGAGEHKTSITIAKWLNNRALFNDPTGKPYLG